ncbi:SDR family NAD(P)-dependent oxidoreductase [Nocardia huaxiensis]|uniref:SDR family NAD(P)-dependent oxidoreductase n=1 Tax=Nocardia huaxiensis TaxID=2755382 RepID=A0A7D6ZKP4_9NOCA|nr:SDR family NAD(P)-dependent oxidoreductase [Nocardia huaxiensis]QLY33539.1 SDR family NAD(P)-dependent oxidoreductase [Nocardia huaxiensis]UFS99545.1 SDR family NAD(P)-dependent oxidoreductase [Nocardia huaxiensis]
MIEFRAGSPRRPRPSEAVAGKRVVITDAYSDIGRATARLLAAQGAEVLLVARHGSQLATECADIVQTGGRAHWFRCDISALGDVDQLVEWLLTDFDSIDVLINNAGRPMRRPVLQSLDRFRDYQRMMAANYFGPLRLTLGLLPAMLAGGSGHVVNVGPWSLTTGAAPNFASYASSQAAWTTFGQCADAELSPRGIHVTTVHYPAPEHAIPDAEEAARWIETAIRTRPTQMQPPRLPRALVGLANMAPRSTLRLKHALGI